MLGYSPLDASPLASESSSSGTNYTLSAGSGAFVFTGHGAVLALGFSAPSGSFVLSGDSASLTANGPITLSCSTGAFTLAGSSVLKDDHDLIANTGNYVLSPHTANLGHQWKVSAVSGSFTFSGQANMAYDRKFPVASGSFTVTGETVTFLTGVGFVLSPGAFALSGHSVSMSYDLAINPPPISVALTGHSSALAYDRKSLGTGAGFSLTGSSTAVVTYRQLKAIPASFNAAGLCALAYDRKIYGNANITLAASANLQDWRKQSVSAGHFTLTGEPAGFRRRYGGYGTLIEFTLGGSPATCLQHFATFTPAHGQFVLGGSATVKEYRKIIGNGNVYMFGNNASLVYSATQEQEWYAIPSDTVAYYAEAEG